MKYIRTVWGLGFRAQSVGKLPNNGQSSGRTPNDIETRNTYGYTTITCTLLAHIGNGNKNGKCGRIHS